MNAAGWALQRLTDAAKRVASGLEALSLKARLAIAFASLFTAVILFSGFLLYQQHRMAANGAQVAVVAFRQMSEARQMQNTLEALDHNPPGSSLGASREIAEFRRAVAQAREDTRSLDGEGLIQRIEADFDNYLLLLDAGDRALARESWKRVAAGVGAFMELNENLVSRMADELVVKEQFSFALAGSFLFILVLLMLLAGYRIVVLLTAPLSALASFVDRLNLEDDLPERLPQFKPEVAEISFVAKSFERLLMRLRGYRALNVRRLLIEKRRADIIAASISDGICLLRGDEVVYANPVAERVLGLVGSSTRACGANAGPPGISLTSLSATGKSPRGVKAFLDAVSRTIPVDLAIEENDQTAHYLVQAYPISFDLIEQFENTVHDSISQMIESFQANTLVVAQDVTLVRESQEAKGHFLATLSHEVKTPVTSLTMATRLLAKTAEEFQNPTHRSLIKTCVEDVDRLRVLLDELLTVSRFDTLTQRLELQNVDLGKLLRHTVQTFQPTAMERGMSLTISVLSKGGPVIVPMDPAKVAWAISNLLLNALRHTPRNGRVQAEVESFDDRVEVRIRDTGPGIDRKRQGRIFDKFSSFYDIRVARSGGAGAGLSIAREIVIAHGGRIWVTSEQGLGAEFCFTLPRKKSAIELPSATAGNTDTRSLRSRESFAVESASAVAASVRSRTAVKAMSDCHSSLRKGESGGASASGG